ncbi:MAG: GatB/YqeY domain-containing protein [Thermoleophilaceae bacterium]
MELIERLKADTGVALKAGDRERVGALRMLSAALQQAEKDSKDGADHVAVLQGERKRRLESAATYRDAGRDDLAEGERREAELIEAYLPAQLSDEELHAIVGDAVAELGTGSPRDMGKVMSAVMPKVGGRADGKRVSAVVQEKLSP